MLFYMNTRTFLNLYLENEPDWKILDTYYVPISHRIRITEKCTNHMLIKGEYLCPSGDVMYQDSVKEMRLQYEHQLSKEKPIFASFIYKSIKDDQHTVFLWTLKESEHGSYLKWMSKWVEREFLYPVYEYEKFAKRKTPIYEYDEKQVLATCKEILNEETRKQKKAAEAPLVKRAAIVDWPKKKLKKELEKYGIYVSDSESRIDMIEMLRDLI